MVKLPFEISNFVFFSFVESTLFNLEKKVLGHMGLAN